MSLRKRLIGAALFALAMMYSQGAAAVTGSATGTISWIAVYGDGRVLVGGLVFPTGTCSNNSGFTIPANHPHIAKILAQLLAAKAQGMSIAVTAKVDNCWYPEITQDATTYIFAGP